MTDTGAKRISEWRSKIRRWVVSLGYTSIENYLTCQYNAAHGLPLDTKHKGNWRARILAWIRKDEDRNSIEAYLTKKYNEARHGKAKKK